MTDKWLFVSDVDDTLLGNDNALAQLMTALNKVGNRVITAYNSSRPCASLRHSLANVPQLKNPLYLIGGLGTEIQAGASGKKLTGYTEYLSNNWDRQRIAQEMEHLGYTPHADEYQTALKASYDVPDEAAYHTAKARLEQAGLAAKIIFSGGKNLDIIPKTAGKGGVINYLHQHLNIAAERVVVSGDSGNDVEMFQAPYRGIVVGNADKDLRRLTGDHIYHAHKNYAAGVLEGLRYWNVL